jgi:hypothetical protein
MYFVSNITRIALLFEHSPPRPLPPSPPLSMSMSLSPQLLHADHLEELQYLAETVGTKLWACKRACPR